MNDENANSDFEKFFSMSREMIYGIRSQEYIQNHETQTGKVNEKVQTYGALQG